MSEYTYQIEATFQQKYNDDERIDTLTINMEHEDPFVAMSRLLDEHHDKDLIEFHSEQVVDEDV